MWREEGAYFLLFNATNVLNYAYLVLVGFLLSTEAYGLFGALFGLVCQASALGNTVTVATARQTAAARARGQRTAPPVADPLRWAAVPAAAAGLLVAGLSGTIGSALDSPRQPLLWTALAVGLSVWVPAGYGLLQGSERFLRLGLAVFSAAAIRAAAGAALLAGGAGVSGAIAGVAVGYAGSGLLTLALASRTQGPGAACGGFGPMPPVRALLAVLVASLTVAAPTSLDVALVRHFLDPGDAGLFTGVAVLGRAVLFSSLAIPFMMVPRLARRAARAEPTAPLLAAGLFRVACVAALTAGGLLLATLVLRMELTGRDLSAASAALYWYLAGMVLFSLVAVVAYYNVATGRSGYVLAVAAPGVLVQAALIGAFHGSLEAIARIVFVTNAAVFLAGLLPLLGSITSARPLNLRARPVDRVDWDEAKV